MPRCVLCVLLPASPFRPATGKVELGPLHPIFLLVSSRPVPFRLLLSIPRLAPFVCVRRAQFGLSLFRSVPFRLATSHQLILRPVPPQLFASPGGAAECPSNQ